MRAFSAAHQASQTLENGSPAPWANQSRSDRKPADQLTTSVKAAIRID